MSTGREILEGTIAKKLKDNPNDARAVGARVAVELTGDEGGRWIIDCTKDPATVQKDDKAESATTIVMSDNDLVKLSQGKMNAVSAFMFGKIKVKGDLKTAIMLGKILS